MDKSMKKTVMPLTRLLLIFLALSIQYWLFQ